jgi:pSer/pThr/pTyr-binding forkhead associated (FHA) protein
MVEDDRTITKDDKDTEKKGESLPAGLRLYLEVLEGPDKGRKFEVYSTIVSLGRRGVDVILNDPTISSRHATLEVSREDILLYDENSTNGTFVNGERISSCPLKNLDEIQLGETKLLLSVIQDRYGIYDEDFAAAQSDISDEETLVKEDSPVNNPPLPENMDIVLEVEEGPNRGQRFKLSRRSTVIGRKGSHIILDDEAVSARHAQIEIYSRDKMTIKDLATANGTQVNDRLISAVKLRHGDRIKIGNTMLVFYARIKT